MKTSHITRSALTLVAAGLLSASAFAVDNVAIPLNGELPRKCDVTAFLNGPFNALDMTSTATQGSESLSPICNYGGTLSVAFSSANGGTMNNTTVAGQNIGYTFTVSGGLLTDVSLATPANVSNWPAVANAVQTRSMSIKLNNAATVAGAYTDTITATVSPN